MGLRLSVSAFAAYGVVCAALLVPLHWLTPVRVTGGSMQPTLEYGDVALIAKRVKPDVGAIALLEVPGHGAVLHRVVHTRGDGLLVTKGDANERADLSTVDPGQSIGTVVAVVPVGRLMKRWRGTDTSDTLTAQPNNQGDDGEQASPEPIDRDGPHD